MTDVLPFTMTPVDPRVKPLSLRNDGRLELFFIGVGSAFARRNFQTNFLIIKGDKHLMVDFGMTGPHALEQTAGLTVTDLESVLPTHSHADHIGGLEAMGLLNRYVGQKIQKKPKLTAIITEEYQRVLWENSLRGGMEYNEEDNEGHNLTFGDFFTVIRPTWKTMQPREIFAVQFGDMKLEIFRTMHIPNTAGSWEASFISYGLFIDGHVFVSVDTRFDHDLIDLYSSRSSVMFHDCQLFMPGSVHAALDELRTLPSDIQRKMMLMHYGDNWEQFDIADFAGWTQQGVRYIF